MFEYLQNLILDFINRHPMMSIGFTLILLSAIGTLSFRRVKIRSNQRISLIMFFAGLLLIVLDLPTQNSDSKQNNSDKNENLPKERNFSSNNNSKEKEVKKIIIQYFEALSSHDANALQDFFAEKAEKFYNQTNINAKRIKKTILENWQTIQSENYQVKEDTWQYKTDEAGNHIIQVDVYRNVSPKNGEVYEETLQIEIRLNQAFKIYYFA